MIAMHAFQLIFDNATLKGSAIGSEKEALVMLKMAADKRIYPIVEKLPINEDNVAEVLQRVAKSDVFVLTDLVKFFV